MPGPFLQPRQQRPRNAGRPLRRSLTPVVDPAPTPESAGSTGATGVVPEPSFKVCELGVENGHRLDTSRVIVVAGLGERRKPPGFRVHQLSL